MEKIEQLVVSFIENMIWGFLFWLIAGFIFGAIFLTIASPTYILITLVGCFLIVFTGFLIKNFNNWNELRKYNEIKKSVDLPGYGEPSLNRIYRLEQKYNLDTLTFVEMLQNGHILRTMDNLDHLEWVALINELPGLTIIKLKGE